MNPPADPGFIILYVENPTKSAAFYANLLGRPPVQASSNFALFALASGVMLGLWARHDVQPAAVAATGSAEIGFTVPGDDVVRACCTDWSARGVKIAQSPVKMDFGFTFTALDPDGHRLRVFAPAAS